MPAITPFDQKETGYGIDPALAIIDDPTLEAFAQIAERTANGEELSEAGGQMLLSLAGPLARELQQHRRAAAIIRDLATPGRVLMFPGADA